jgi:hypothetical protein
MARITFGIYLVLTVASLVIYLGFPELFIALSEEDGLIEWLTFFGYLVAGIIFAWTGLVRHRGNFLRGWFLFFLALGCVFVAGEEISWGQRLCRFATPEAIGQYNFQNELNLHNLGDFGRDWPRRIYMLGMFCYLILLPVSARVSGALSSRARKLGVVVPPLKLAAPFIFSLVLPLYNKMMISIGAELPRYHNYAVEVMEFFSGLIFLHLALIAAGGKRAGRGPGGGEQ